MATLRQQYDLAADPKFSKRVQQGAITVAFEVLVEDPKTPGHPLRVALAQGVLSDPASQETRMSAAILTDDATFAAQVDSGNVPSVTRAADLALLARLRSVWSVLSGYAEEAAQ